MKDSTPANWAAKVAPHAVIVLGSFFLFREILVTGKCLYGSDFVLQFYPWKKFVFDHLQSHGSLPFWNPYLFSGSPLIPNIQLSFFYPLGFLYYLMPPDIAYGYSTLLHFILGLFFMYLFMRSLEARRPACIFSSTAFMFSGYFMGHLYAGHLSFVQNYIWIPLIFYFLNRFVNEASIRDAVAAGFVLGFQILGGFPQIAFYTLLASSLFILFGGVPTHRGGKRVSLFQMGAGWAVFVFLGFALAAVQVLPTYEFTTLSTRGGGISYEMATYESLHPKELLAFLLPDIYGNATDGTYWRSREFWHFWESCGYVGVLPLFLFFIKSQSPRASRVPVFFVVLVGLSLFLAFGKYNPLYPLIYKLPGFGSFRLPAQILFLYVFGVTVLSGLGLNRIMEGGWKPARGFWIFTAVSGLLLGVALLGSILFRFEFFLTLFREFSEGPVMHANLSMLHDRISSTIQKSSLMFSLCLLLILLLKHGKIQPLFFSLAACLIVFVDLYTFVSPFVRTHEWVTSAEKERVVSKLFKTAAMGRVVTMDSLFDTNDGLRYRFPSVQGYDPLILKKYVDFVLASQNLPPNDHVVNLQEIPLPEEKLMKLLNARQLVSAGQVEWLENGIPYAFLVPKGIEKPEEEILSFMKSEEFDPRKVVVFAGQPKQGLLQRDTPSSVIGSCEVLKYGAEEIRLRVSCDHPAYLVMSEIWYPGWVASAGGKKEEVMAGNYLFRVVPVEPDNHEITLTFVSWPFRIGAGVSLASLLAGLCLWRHCRRREAFKGAS